ncbi:type II secretion system protein K (GspK) [Sphingomonas laterariae]|uniref:Type II secretion system protein K n=1 Tax=Edaphosphingomonas laterariae TaxID=861865 RepID=A0A239BBK6_9SPHN|nr:type II secretion system minor pseudopilin GspK [Sphingomonas laterariae]SNS04554.1 type II secretion system protein K (GspK) [Sphingomonas laterariae]
MKVPYSERGGALLTVLLLVAVMSALSVAALERLRLSTRLAANGAAADQARAYALGAESMALDRIGVLSGRDTGMTTLAGGWHGRPLALPLPGGIVTATLTDGGNCFNLNSVAEGLIAGDYAPREVGIRQFVALMQSLGMDGAEARRVAASLVDWIDADSAPNPDGAEDDYYMQAATPYRAANTLLGDVSELRAVAGVTPEIYRLLRPWVCALPTTDLSPININTLSMDQAPLVAMLIPDQLDIPRARQILAERPATGWSSTVDFWKLPALEALTPDMEVQGQTQLRTRWFNLALDVEIGGAQVSETALIDGGLTPARLVSRKWGGDE